MNVATADSTETLHLLDRIRDGEPKAINPLLARYRTYLRQIISLQFDPKLRTRVDVSDVVQETQMEVTRRIDEFLERRPMPFRVWLRKTAHQRMLIIRRRHASAACRAVGREVPLPDQTSLRITKRLFSAGPTPSEQLNRQELARQVRQAMAKLLLPDRQILLMRYFEELSYDEIGYVLDIDPTTAMKRHGRAVLRLHKILRDAGFTETQA